VTAGKLWRAVGIYFDPPSPAPPFPGLSAASTNVPCLTIERVLGVPDLHNLGDLPGTLKDKTDSEPKASNGPDNPPSGLPPTSGSLGRRGNWGLSRMRPP